ncbi:MAG: FemAB family PEP-CTERM system-associated protein [Magnetococcales bacterium]|nr:FemAB family PEP-CTERM system-associated protein [Magnetococcales bacterium]
MTRLDGVGLRLRTLESIEDAARWDAFVEQCAEATFFHKAGWKSVIESSFSQRGHYIYVEDDHGAIQGVLPLVRQKTLLFGDALISTPFCVYGGVATENDAARTLLEEKAVSLAEAMGVDYLELRNRTDRSDESQHSDEPLRSDWIRKDLYYSFCKGIDADPDLNLKAIPRKQRAEVRRGIKNGLQGEVDDDPGRCYDLYSESVRNLGTPVFSRRYFYRLQEVFGSACEPLVISREGEPVSAVLSFYFRDQVLPYYGGALFSARRVGAYAFMYWHLMNRAAERGAHTFDFGRSKRGTGSYDFKRYFGFEPEPLAYDSYLVRAQEMPEINPLNPKYQLFIRLWKRLPLGVSRVVGPWLARGLG